jgi:hypothetical protein
LQSGGHPHTTLFDPSRRPGNSASPNQSLKYARLTSAPPSGATTALVSIIRCREKGGIHRISSLGLEVVGPIADLDKALDLAANALLDCAILDINIRGGLSYPVADILLNRGLPLLLLTGYSERTLPERLHKVAHLPKPFADAQLEK